jgi:hypothetical protein
MVPPDPPLPSVTLLLVPPWPPLDVPRFDPPPPPVPWALVPPWPPLPSGWACLPLAQATAKHMSTAKAACLLVRCGMLRL